MFILSVCVCVYFVWIFFCFFFAFVYFLELAVFPNLRPHSLSTMFLRLKKKTAGFFSFSWVLLWDWACKGKKKNVKCYRPCNVLSSTGFFSIVMLKQNELKPLLNLPQSSLHQASGCDSWVLALHCQIWKFSLPLKNKQTKRHKNKFTLISCITMLATLS